MIFVVLYTETSAEVFVVFFLTSYYRTKKKTNLRWIHCIVLK